MAKKLSTFRIETISLNLLDALAEKHKRSKANMIEVLIDEAAARDLSKKEIEAAKKLPKEG